MILTATISEYGSLNGKLIGFNAFFKQVLQDAVRLWYDGKAPEADGATPMLPLHFTTAAPSLYPGVYKLRGKQYMIQKAHKKGHQDPLTYTGTMMRELMRTIRLTGTHKQARGTMSGSNRALNFSGHSTSLGGKYPDMRAELTALSAHEEKVLADYIDRRVQAWLASDTPVEKKQL